MQNDVLQAVLQAVAKAGGKWDESQHPRDPKGRFGEGEAGDSAQVVERASNFNPIYQLSRHVQQLKYLVEDGKASADDKALLAQKEKERDAAWSGALKWARERLAAEGAGLGREPAKAGKAPKPGKDGRFKDGKSFAAWVESDEKALDALEKFTDPDAFERMKKNQVAAAAGKAKLSSENVALERAVAAAPLVFGPLYRGMSELSDGQLAAFTRVGSTFSSRAHDSWSTDRAVGSEYATGQDYEGGRRNGVLLRLKKASNAGDISGVSGFSESEAVVPGGTKYRVVAVKPHPTLPRQYVVDIEEVSDGKRSPRRKR